MCTCLSALLLSSHCSLCSSRWEERQNRLGPSDGGKRGFRSHTQKHTFKETEQRLNSAQNLFKEPNRTVTSRGEVTKVQGGKSLHQTLIDPTRQSAVFRTEEEEQICLWRRLLSVNRHTNIQMRFDNRFVEFCSLTVTSHDKLVFN